MLVKWTSNVANSCDHSHTKSFGLDEKSALFSGTECCVEIWLDFFQVQNESEKG